MDAVIIERYATDDVTVRASDGSVTTRERRTACCRCGPSSNEPDCDGSHGAAGLEG